MKLVVGLGNPGAKYEKSRHNLGFMVIDSYASMLGLEWSYSRDWICFWAKNIDVLLIKPSTFMNKSGAAVKAVCDYYKIDMGDILVICDDVDLPFAKIRLAFDGLSAGHKGVDSVVQYMGGFDFAKLKVGIGRPSYPTPNSGSKVKVPNVADYVLEDFSKEERKKLDEVIIKCREAVNSYIADGIEATMNRYN